jgi:Na+:H+ antiporter
VLAPIFFASVGLHLDLRSLVEVPLFVSLMLLVAIIGKVVGAGGAAMLMGMRPRAAASVGVAMSVRGAVELIIAGVALRAGLFEHPKPVPNVVANMFSTTVVMAIVTTLLAPIALRPLLPREPSTPSDEARL